MARTHYSMVRLWVSRGNLLDSLWCHVVPCCELER